MTRERGVRRTPLEILEELATERLGRGSAISLDRVPRQDKGAGHDYVAVAWRPNGVAACASKCWSTKERAIADLRRVLENWRSDT